MGSGIVDFEKFKNDTGLDSDTVKDLYRGFWEEIIDEKEKIVIHLAKKDYGKLEKTVHNLKGISSSYMAVNVYQQSLTLDTQLKKKDFRDIGELVDRLVSDVEAAAEEIVSYCML